MSCFQFQSAPLAEARGDFRATRQAARFAPFQSAPLAEARGDIGTTAGYIGAFLFQSAPLAEARGDPPASLRRPAGKLPVSIRSPCRSKGRWRCTRYARRACRFQSAPLAEARGDLSASAKFSTSARFQSAPLAEARGDVVVLALIVQPGSVSIRSPCRSKGRFRRVSTSDARRASFNPLPLPKQGEMLVAVTSKFSAGYTGRYAIQSNSDQQALFNFSKDLVTGLLLDVSELRESTGETPLLYLRASYNIRGALRSNGSMTPWCSVSFLASSSR